MALWNACCVCLEEDLPTFQCAEGHSVCQECFVQHVRVEAGVDGQMPRRPDGEAQCPGRVGQHQCQHVFAPAHILRHAALAFDAYVQGRINSGVAARRHQEQEHADQQQADPIALLLAHVVDNILTLKCPRAGCRQAFMDFEGCNAVTCHSCGCGFCAICFEDCGQDAHDHIRRMHPGDMYWRREDWEAHMEVRKKDQIQQLIEEVRRTLENLAPQAIPQAISRRGHLLRASIDPETKVRIEMDGFGGGHGNANRFTIDFFTRNGDRALHYGGRRDRAVINAKFGRDWLAEQISWACRFPVSRRCAIIFILKANFTGVDDSTFWHIQTEGADDYIVFKHRTLMPIDRIMLSDNVENPAIRLEEFRR